ncbi:unnamed protein product [Rotaria sordida]|uniref:RBR-type E3 ubiquitin transferase n=1 Tax=Rotaria sordida TaxID=392033 RepID=A0A818YH67_9BILA|nr:unnamed protein product [Rotaria sordida]CAF3756573.1 unnamed protein product [Rotaria sordida]
MASNSIDDEKPNLRPTKYNNASGKSLYLHHNPNQSSTKSYIHAIWKNIDEQLNESFYDKQDLFGIQQPHIEYSLNKQQRWNILNDIHEYIANQSNSSSDNEFNTQFDLKQRRKKKKTRQQYINIHQTKYHLYEFHQIERKSNCIRMTNNTTERHVQTPRKTYMNKSINNIKKKEEQNHQNNNVEHDNNKTKEVTPDITYFAVVPAPREKQLVNIKKNSNTKRKKTRSYIQRDKFTEVKERLDSEEQLENEKENLSTDDDESIISHYTFSKPDELQLSDFITITSIDDNNNNKISFKCENSDQINKCHSKSLHTSSDQINSLQQKNRFYRQISTEEKFYNQDMTTYVKMQRKPNETNKSKGKSSHRLMSLSFRTIFLHQTELTIEYLSKTYGKNFLHAQCYPTKYLICLTDRLKSFQWSNKLNFFSSNRILNCYLIIILNNNELNNENNICQGQVALNMDLYTDTIEIENLSQSKDNIYKIDELINKTIEFITNLSTDKFKSINLEINQRKLYPNEIDNQLSECEFINKQIHQIHLLDKNDLQNKLNIEELNNNNNNLSRPDICTNCCCDMNELTPMTALKSCSHWLCNHCWKQYLENSIKSIRVIRCPEWNCCSLVDIGTILSLVNIHYMNIYERNIEKCLVNLSRSYIKCPLKSCSIIFQIIDSGIDYVRCRCGHQFCIDCKQEPHFPATCTSYRAYIDEVYQNGDLLSDYNTKLIVRGRHCVSCNNFIEKNGGCNHMTCRCGAEFCWLCTAYWKDHFSSNGEFQCPKQQISIQKKVLTKERNPSRKLYELAIHHRHQRTFQNQTKQNENVKRLIGTIPLDRETCFDTKLIKSQIDKREELLRHSYEMVKYIIYLHRICEFIAVAADGYANNPIEFSNSIYLFETLIFNMSQLIESGRGYQAIEQLNDLYKKSEKLIERLRHAVILRKTRRINQTGYVTS